MSTSILSRLSRKENQEYRASNKSLKFKTHRVLRPANTSNLTVFDDRQITQQLNQELNTVDQIIKSYKLKLEFEELSRKRYTTIEEDVLALEETILLKDYQIRDINEEIKLLKVAKDRETPRGNKGNSTSSEVFTLASELRRQRLQLKELIQIHNQKVTNRKMLMLAVKRLQNVFIDKFPTRQIGYEFYKEKQIENRREENSKKKKKELWVFSIRQRGEISLEPSAIVRSDAENRSESKSMKELQDKKRITKLAIRNANKKHQNQISELTAKLQFLRDENALLDQKIRDTEIQKINLQGRFSINIQNRRNKKHRQFASENSYL